MSFYDWAALNVGFERFNSPADEEGGGELMGDELARAAAMLDQKPFWKH